MKHILVQAWKQRPSLTVREHLRRILIDTSPKLRPENKAERTKASRDGGVSWPRDNNTNSRACRPLLGV